MVLSFRERSRPVPVPVPVRMRVPAWAEAAVIGLIALLLRAPLTVAALPQFSNSDEPLNLLTGIHMADAGTVDPHSYRYPSMLYDAIAAVTASFRLTGLPAPAHGGITVQNLGVAQTHAQTLVIAIRLVGVLASVATCLLVWLTVRMVTTRRWCAVAAALALAVSPLAVANSAYVTPDVYAGLALASALYGAVRIAVGRAYGALLSGVGVGCALGSKYLAAAAIPVAVAAVLRHGVRRSASRSLADVTGVAVLVFAVTTPALLIAPGRVWDGLAAEIRHYHSGHSGAEGDAPWFYLNTLFHDQPLLVLAGLSASTLVIADRGMRTDLRRALLVALAYVGPQFVLIASMDVRFARNLVPIGPALAVVAGCSAAALADCADRRLVMWPGRLSRAALVLALLALLVPLWSALRLYPALDERSRVDAAAWITAHVRTGQTVVVEGYGPWLDPARVHVVSTDFVTDLAALPSDTRAVVVTEHAAGRFLGDPRRYPVENAAYRSLFTRLRPAARFSDGSWIEIYVPR